jgi:hypothetical protein
MPLITRLKSVALMLSSRWPIYMELVMVIMRCRWTYYVRAVMGRRRNLVDLLISSA